MNLRYDHPICIALCVAVAFNPCSASFPVVQLEQHLDPSSKQYRVLVDSLASNVNVVPSVKMSLYEPPSEPTGDMPLMRLVRLQETVELPSVGSMVPIICFFLNYRLMTTC